MKKLAIYFMILMPCLAFGQLFPKVPDFKGNIREVVEKKYGKEARSFRFLGITYRSATFSGWKYTFDFDENSKLVKQTEAFKNEIRAEYIYQRKTEGSQQIVREITTDNNSGHEGDYLETENYFDQKGRLEKVNYRSFDAKSGKSSLYLIEKDAKYIGERLSSFSRQLIDENGDTSGTEVCKLFYDSSGRLSRIERADAVSGFKTTIYYHYNNRGWVVQYSVDLLTELQEIGKNQVQHIYYSYDSHGNWTRSYWLKDKKKHLEAKRKNKYW